MTPRPPKVESKVLTKEKSVRKPGAPTSRQTDALYRLLNGSVLDDLRGALQDIENAFERHELIVERLETSEMSKIKAALRDILDQPDYRIEYPDLPALEVGAQPSHYMMPLILKAMQLRLPTWIWGDAGSGKTTAAAQAAKCLGLEFTAISVCPTTTKSELLGYMDANGNYRGTAFYEAYLNGGVYLIDEIDNGNPSILSVLNSALANDWCAFPCGNVTRHPDFVAMAAANTIGRGADTKYVGRNALDATTLDRFVFIKVDIDRNLEQRIIGIDVGESNQVDITLGGTMNSDKWRDFIWRLRDEIAEQGLDHMISPRAMINGNRLLRAGVGVRHVRNMCVWKGIRRVDKLKLCRALGIEDEDDE